MFSIVDRQELTKRDMISLTVEAPAIARRIRPGQFVILRVNETGERLPLTVAYADATNGTLTIIFQVVGKSTALLASLPSATPSGTSPARSARSWSSRTWARWSGSAAVRASPSCIIC